MEENKIEIEITNDVNGVPVELDRLSLSATNSLITFLQSLSKISELTSETKEVKIEIRSGSCIVSSKLEKNQIIRIERDLEDIIANNSTDDVLVSHWKAIQEVINKNGLTYKVNIIKNGIKTPILNKLKGQPTFRVKSVKSEIHYKLLFLTGELINIGGTTPNFHFVEPNKGKITISCRREEASKITKYLYKKIRISVWERSKGTEKSHYEFCDFYSKPVNFELFENFHSKRSNLAGTQRLKEIHYFLMEVLQKKLFVTANKFMKTFNHKSVDIGSLRMILVVTKAFQEQPKLITTRKEIKNILENIIGKIN